MENANATGASFVTLKCWLYFAWHCKISYAFDCSYSWRGKIGAVILWNLAGIHALGLGFSDNNKSITQQYKVGMGLEFKQHSLWDDGILCPGALRFSQILLFRVGNWNWVSLPYHDPQTGLSIQLVLTPDMHRAHLGNLNSIVLN